MTGLEIRECGKACCARMGRVAMACIASGGATPHPGRIPLMPSVYADRNEWERWYLDTCRWVDYTGGNDLEGVKKKAWAVLAGDEEMRQARQES